MLITAVYNLVDTYFVSGLGTEAMGALTAAFPLSQAVVGLGLLFGNGAAAYLSRLLGRGQRETAAQTASTALYSSLLVGAAVIAVMLMLLAPLLRLAGALESVLPYALTYCRITILFSIFNVFNVTMNNIVSSEGAAKWAMLALAAGALLNVCLDPLLIYALGWGIAGAAWATALSQMVTAGLYLAYILRGHSLFAFRPSQCRFTGPIMAEILKIGIPTLIFQLLTSLSIGMTGEAIKAYGPSALAAMGPVTKLMTLGSLTVFGFLKGFQPIAGFSYGAGNLVRLRQAIRTALLWSTLFCTLYGLTMALLAQPIMAQFTANDAEMLHIGQRALTAYGLSFLCFGFYTVYSFLLLVMGRARAGCFLGACRQGLCFVPLILLLPKVLGLPGVLYAQPAADVLAAMITLGMARHLHKQLSAGGAAEAKQG